jgi:urocanate hydratase
MDINLDKDNYTKEEVQAIVDGLQGTITGLNEQIEDGKEAIKKVKELEKSNLDNSIKLAMTKANLSDDLFDLVQAETVEKAQKKIDKLTELQKAKDIDKSYKPEGKRTEDQYSKLKDKKDVEGMIGSKLSKLFQ